MKRLRKLIDTLLAENRPDRYLIRDSTRETADDEDDAIDVDDEDEVSDTGWLDDIATEIVDLIPEAEAKQLYARALVGGREKRATTGANGFLRKIQRTGQLPLGWLDLEPFPISVITRMYTESRPRIREERVALRAASADDFEKFAIETRRVAGKKFAATNETASGAERLAEWIRISPCNNFHDWAEGQ
jgi:hypothetical protein